MSDGRRVTVTLKYGPGYEVPWAVFNGTPEEIRADVINYFQLGEDELKPLASLNDLVAYASGLVLGANINGAAGKVTGAGLAGRGRRGTSRETTTKPDVIDPRASLLVMIGEASDELALKRVWAENKTAFTDPEVMKAYQERGRALKHNG